MSDQDEKTVTVSKQVASPATYDGAIKAEEGSAHRGDVDPIPREDWRTRNGLNLRSFTRREEGEGAPELDRSMKGRHLHMIAIGLCPSFPFYRPSTD